MTGTPPRAPSPSAAADARDDAPAQDAEARSSGGAAGGASDSQGQQQQQQQQTPTLDRPQEQEAAPSTEATAQQQQQQQEAEQQPPAAAGQDPSASPPLPGRHTATTPGPRAARLRETYAHALRRTLAKLAAWDHFAGCYPTVAARAEPVLRQVQAQMVQKLGDKCEKEFDDILVARGVVPKLNELEALIADAAERRDASSSAAEPTPPHLLPPAQILAAHLAAHLASHQSLLNARLQMTQARNAELARAVARQRTELDALLARLDDAVADVRAANLALGPVAHDLAEEARAAAVDDAP